MSSNPSVASQEAKSDEFLVTFDGIDDREDVIHLANWRKWLVVFVISITSVNITCVSSLWSLASEHIMAHFHISHEVSALGIAFYIWGLGIGGIFLLPISEYHGRKVVYLSGLFLSVCFQILTAFSENIGGVLFGRFAAGFFGLSFMAVASGTFSDLFRKTDRNAAQGDNQNKHLGRALVLYSASPFVGPGLGPLISGFINNSDISFRWTFHVMILWTAALFVLVAVMVPESYEPELLKRKAKRLRNQTGDSRYYALVERSHTSLFESVVLSCKRPILLMFRDQMTLALCFYTAFTLAVVYMFFVSFPYTFSTVYNFNPAQIGMSFLGLVAGFGLTSIITPPYIEKIQRRLITKYGKDKPEFKLVSLLIGVFIVPPGLFIMAWTCYPHVHWIGPIIGSFVYACGTVLVFSGIFSYQITAYRYYAALAMATNSFVRSILAGVFDLFALQMYQGLGVHWASCLLAIFSIVLIPIPFFFFKYGEAIRHRSSYTWSDD